MSPEVVPQPPRRGRPRKNPVTVLRITEEDRAKDPGRWNPGKGDNRSLGGPSRATGDQPWANRR